MAAGVKPSTRLTGTRDSPTPTAMAGVDQERVQGGSRVPAREGAGGPGVLRQRVRARLDRSRGPDFFLIPGENQVTVLWRPSATETTGDPSFAALASTTTVDREADPNPLYDPNYRQFDVEGYRVYRGGWTIPASSSSLPSSTMPARSSADFRGQVNPVPDCAPELGINKVTSGATAADTTFGCPGCPSTRVVPGVAPTVSDTIPLRGADRPGQAGRPKGDRGWPPAAVLLRARHRPHRRRVGLPRGCRPQRCGVHVARYRRAVRVRGPRGAKRSAVFLCGHGVRHQLDSVGPVEPRVAEADEAGNAGELRNQPGALRYCPRHPRRPRPHPRHGGRAPALDPATGRFSGPFPPANGFAFGLADLVQTLLPDSRPARCRSRWTVSSSARPTRAATGKQGLPVQLLSDGRGRGRHRSIAGASGAGSGLGPESGVSYVDASARWTKPPSSGSAAVTNSSCAAASTFGSPATTTRAHGDAAAAAPLQDSRPPGPQAANTMGRAGSTDPRLNGTRPRPTHSARTRPTRPTPGPMADLNNAGVLTGVATIQMPHSYETAEAGYRVVEGVLGGAQRAADFNLWWGADGRIDSVIDVTHNVAVPFDSLRLAGSWGVLNQAAPPLPDRSTADRTCSRPWISPASSRSALCRPSRQAILAPRLRSS